MKLKEAAAALGVRALDWLIFLVVLGIGVIWLVFPVGFKGNERVQIIQNGEITAEYRLGAEEVVTINGDTGWNVIKIADTAEIVDASCPDKLCEEKHISRPGEAIVCLPNELIVRIVGVSEVDDIAY